MPKPNSSTSNFSRFLLRILLPLIALVSLGGVSFNYLFEKTVILKNENGGAYKVNRVLKETHPDEIPIFGSSRAEGCIIPDSLGQNYFNYGLSGTKYDVTIFLLFEECRKTKSTPWILLNLDLDGLYYGLGDIGNYLPNTNNKHLRDLMSDQYKFYYRIPFLKYYGRFESYLGNYLNQRISLTKFSDKGAYIEKNALPKKEFDEMVKERENSDEGFLCYDRLKNLLTDAISSHPNRSFVFFISPYHKSFFKKYSGTEKANNFLKELKSYKNVTVFDFSKMELPDSMFFNTSHINLQGAIVFTHALKDSLATLGVR